MARREDIDGLRALAVLLVLMFHAQLNDLKGGFVGVDVFFVISGYLIIPIIVKSQTETRFDFLRFLVRRLRRLMPAAVPVFIYSFFVGAFLLGDVSFTDFLESLLGAATYTSNIVFFWQAGYFDTSSHQKLLLHTWSLAVELQFYLLTPIFLWIARGNKRTITILLGGLSAASFVLSEVWRAESGHAAFYLMAPRFWEFGIGGLMALNLPDRRGPLISALVMRGTGICAILWAATTYNQDTGFPGLGALLPVLGAALVLSAPHCDRDPLGLLLTSRWAGWIGVRSYSIYLWHWPLMVTAGLYGDRVTEGLLVALAIVSIILANFSFRWFENANLPSSIWQSPLVFASLICFVPLGWVFATFLPSDWRKNIALGAYRDFQDMIAVERENYMATTSIGENIVITGFQCSLDEMRYNDLVKPGAKIIDCLNDHATKDSVLVIGDSHGRDVFQSLRRAFPSKKFYLLHQSACIPADYHEEGKKPCFQGLEEIIRGTNLLPGGHVILAARWREGDEAYLKETGKLLRQSNQNVMVFGVGPYFKTDVPHLLRKDRNYVIGNDATLIPSSALRYDAEQIERNLRLFSDQNRFLFVPKYNHFCAESFCKVFIQERASDLLFWDDQHLTVKGLDWYADVIRREPKLASIFGD